MLSAELVYSYNFNRNKTQIATRNASTATRTIIHQQISPIEPTVMRRVIQDSSRKSQKSSSVADQASPDRKKPSGPPTEQADATGNAHIKTVQSKPPKVVRNTALKPNAQQPVNAAGVSSQRASLPVTNRNASTNAQSQSSMQLNPEQQMRYGPTAKYRGTGQVDHG